MRDFRAFPVDNVVALTGLSEWQLRTWARDGFFRAEFSTDEDETLLYSFRDLVGLRTIAMLRKQHDVPLQRLKRFGEWLHARYEKPWSSLKFKVVGKELYFDDPETGAAIGASPPGQTIATQIIELEPIAREIETAIHDLWQRKAQDIGKVGKYRGVLGSAPVIAGTRVPTKAIAQLHEDGLSFEQIISEYPQLTESDIRAALEFEQKKPPRRRRAG